MFALWPSCVARVMGDSHGAARARPSCCCRHAAALLTTARPTRHFDVTAVRGRRGPDGRPGWACRTVCRTVCPAILLLIAYLRNAVSAATLSKYNRSGVICLLITQTVIVSKNVECILRTMLPFPIHNDIEGSGSVKCLSCIHISRSRN